MQRALAPCAFMLGQAQAPNPDCCTRLKHVEEQEKLHILFYFIFCFELIYFMNIKQLSDSF